ncbi:MAG: sigma-70 family RNA polymerase sigma factor [Bacteroidota bacterium]
MTKINERNSNIEELLKRVRQCDAVAQRELYDTLVLRMFNTVLRIVKNREDAEDCLQMGFSILFHKIDRFDPKKGKFTAWATRIFINEALGLLRHRKIQFDEICDNLFVEAHSMSPLDILNAEDIVNQMNQLPDQMRVIFNLYEIEGYSHKEIAQMLEIAESSSRTYLMRAKQKLRVLINEWENDTRGINEYYN